MRRGWRSGSSLHSRDPFRYRRRWWMRVRIRFAHPFARPHSAPSFISFSLSSKKNGGMEHGVYIYIYGWGGNFRFEGLTRVWTRFEYRSVTFCNEICRDKVIFSVCNLDIRLRYVEKREELSRILILLLKLKKKYFLFVTIFIRNWYEYNVIHICTNCWIK